MVLSPGHKNHFQSIFPSEQTCFHSLTKFYKILMYKPYYPKINLTKRNYPVNEIVSFLVNASDQQFPQTLTDYLLQVNDIVVFHLHLP